MQRRATAGMVDSGCVTGKNVGSRNVSRMDEVMTSKNLKS